MGLHYGQLHKWPLQQCAKPTGPMQQSVDLVQAVKDGNDDLHVCEIGTRLPLDERMPWTPPPLASSKKALAFAITADSSLRVATMAS